MGWASPGGDQVPSSEVLGPETQSAGINVFHGILVHTWPPEVP